MRISDWSSDVCSSDLPRLAHEVQHTVHRAGEARGRYPPAHVTQEILVRAADNLQRGVAGSEQRVCNGNELPEIDPLGNPVDAAKDDGPARVGPRDVPRYRLDRKSTRLTSSD